MKDRSCTLRYPHLLASKTMYTIVIGRSNPKRGDTLGYLLYVDDLPYVVVLSFDEAKRRAEPHIVKSLPKRTVSPLPSNGSMITGNVTGRRSSGKKQKSSCR